MQLRLNSWCSLSSLWNISSWFLVLGIFYAIVLFIMGLSEAYATGLFFKVGIIAAGWFLGDAVTIVGGFISIAGLVLSLLRKR
jgi:hypothetical protein